MKLRCSECESNVVQILLSFDDSRFKKVPRMRDGHPGEPHRRQF